MSPMSLDRTVHGYRVMVQVRGQIMGFIVDAVSDVLNVAGADIQPSPNSL